MEMEALVEFLHSHRSASSASAHAHYTLYGASSPPASVAQDEALPGDSHFASVDEDAGGGRGSVVLEASGRLCFVLLTCIFAIAGFFLGAAAGGLRGLGTETGLFRGAGIGAVSGTVFSIDVAESSLLIWRYDRSGLWSILYVIEIIGSLLSGRLLREKVGPAVMNAVQSQMSAVDSPSLEVLDIFETGDIGGLATSSVDLIPKLRITTENGLDASGERISCAVCLQDLEPGEMARRLPHCGHMFHLPCIDCWLLRQASCPLCRRNF